MIIWPTSGTLSEAGSLQAGSGPNIGGGGMGGGMPGGGMGGGMPGGGMGGLMQALNAGEIMLNRAESIALAALETEENPDNGVRRASLESGLSKQQVQKLQRRAQHASSRGYTLKGMGFIKKPQGQAAPDEPGLTRAAQKGEPPEPKAPKKPTTAAKEATALLTDRGDTEPTFYQTPEFYRYPVPHSASEPEGSAEATKETNSMTTLAALLARKRRARY